MTRRFLVPFAAEGDRSEIPTDVQPTGTVSYRQGFGPDYALGRGVPGRKPVPRREYNQALFDITEALGEIQLSGVSPWVPEGENPDGYPYGAIASHGGFLWRSRIAANTVEPGAGTAWARLGDQSTAGEDLIAWLGAATPEEQAALFMRLYAKAAVQDSASVAITGTGLQDDPLTASVRLDPAAGQAIAQGEDGLIVPTARMAWDNETKIIQFTDNKGAVSQIDLSQFVADIYINGGEFDPETAILTLHPNDPEIPDVTVDLGALSESATENSASVAMTGTGASGAPLSASVRIDPAAGNMLEVSPAGLRVPTPDPTGVQEIIDGTATKVVTTGPNQRRIDVVFTANAVDTTAGRALKAGDFGIGAAEGVLRAWASITANSTPSGVYCPSTGGEAPAPFGQYAYLIKAQRTATNYALLGLPYGGGSRPRALTVRSVFGSTTTDQTVYTSANPEVYDTLHDDASAPANVLVLPTGELRRSAFVPAALPSTDNHVAARLSGAQGQVPFGPVPAEGRIATWDTGGVLRGATPETGDGADLVNRGHLQAVLPGVFAGAINTDIPGLVPGRNAASTNTYLRADGKWITPTNTTYAAMTAALLAAGTDTANRVVSASVLAGAFLPKAGETELPGTGAVSYSVRWGDMALGDAGMVTRATMGGLITESASGVSLWMNEAAGELIGQRVVTSLSNAAGDGFGTITESWQRTPSLLLSQFLMDGGTGVSVVRDYTTVTLAVAPSSTPSSPVPRSELDSRLSPAQRNAINALNPATATAADIVNALKAT